MCRLLLCLVALAFCAAADDAREIVRRSVNRDDENLKAARNYTFRERAETRTFDAAGHPNKTEIEAYDVTLVDGTPYRRLISRDDKPLPAKDERKEQDKLRRIADERRKETAAEREKRLAEHDRKQEQHRATIREVLNAFDFRLVGEDHREGRNQYVIEATPHAGYQPHSRNTSFFPKLKGKIWIDRKDYHWVRVEAEVIETISFGAFLVRFAKGSHLEAEQTRVNDEVWLPKRLSGEASARVALLKKVHARLEMTFSDYKKFQTDSRVVSTGESP